MIQICKGRHEVWGYSLETQVATNGNQMFLILSIFERGEHNHPIGVTIGCLNDILQEDLHPHEHTCIQALIFERDLISTIHVLFQEYISHSGLEIDVEYLDSEGCVKTSSDDMYMEACYE